MPEKQYPGTYCKKGKDLDNMSLRIDKNRDYEVDQRHDLLKVVNARMLAQEDGKLNTKVFYFTAMMLIGVLGFLFTNIAGVEGELRGYQTETRETLTEIQVAIAKMQVSIDNLVKSD